MWCQIQIHYVLMSYQKRTKAGDLSRLFLKKCITEIIFTIFAAA